MSHFTVMVIGENPEKQLAKFQENNMGDCPEEFMEFVDKRIEYQEEYDTGSKERIRLANGDLKSKYDRMFMYEDENDVDPLFKKPKTKYKYPEDSTEVNVPIRVLYDTIEDYLEDSGYEVDEKTGKYGWWENPNAKWDWYQLGGRWTGMLKLKDAKLIVDNIEESDYSRLMKKHDVTKEEIDRCVQLLIQPNLQKKGEMIGLKYQLNKELEEIVKLKYKNGLVGQSGLMTPLAEAGWVDRAYKKDIDFEGMKEQARKRNIERYKKVANYFGGEIPKVEKSWNEFLEDDSYVGNHSKRREDYLAQPAMQKFKEVRNSKNIAKEDRGMMAFLSLDEYQFTEEEYGQKGANDALGTFAILIDGEWFEKGKMGWFGMADIKVEEDVWAKQQLELVENLEEHDVISIYDCHI